MARQPDDDSCRALASVPMEYAPPPRAADSKLIAQVRLLGRPLEHLPAGTWSEQRLPRHEINLVRTAGIDLLVPVAIHAGGTEALLALGVKRSEEPYIKEDQELLEAIAASLATAGAIWLLSPSNRQL